MRYSLFERARVRFSVERAVRGRAVGGRCRKTTRRNRKRRPCTRYAHVRGSFVRNGKAGRSRFRFTGRIRRRELKPGGYRLVAVASNATGRSAPKRVGFKIVP